MSFRSLARRLAAGFILLVVGSLVFGPPIGQPILLSYVETGSMAPTMNPGDGFVAVPAGLDGPVGEDDVVVLRAEEIQGSGLTTHRVAKRRTAGSSRRATRTHSPIRTMTTNRPSRAQAVAALWQPGGAALVSPGFGVVVTGTQGIDALAATGRSIGDAPAAGHSGLRVYAEGAK